MSNRILHAVFLFFLLVSAGIAQESRKALTNSDVVDMSKAGLPEATIVLAIQKGPTSFDTSPQVLIQLKNQGVSAGVLDAMLQASAGPAPSNQSAPPARPNNPVNPLASGSSQPAAAAGGIFLIDGATRVQMKYSTPEAKTNSMLGGVMNPFHKARGRAALAGNHAQLRIKNTSPTFEVSIMSDANPSDQIVLVKLKAKSETREIETFRGSITGVSSGFRKEDRLPVTLEDAGQASGNQKTYRVKLVNPLVPGEYALVYSGYIFYDFGVDAN
jgi:hypothetical protein